MGLLMAAAAAAMMTTWGEKVTPENAWRDYPRPQMVRANWTNLNGDWDYAVTSVTNTPGRPEVDVQQKPAPSAGPAVRSQEGEMNRRWHARDLILL